MAKIYLLLSQSGTIPARVLKWFTNAEYNHISLGLSPDLMEMYSFGRKYLYLPIPGGFVSEARNRGVFERFPHAEIALLEIEISEEKFALLSARLKEMLANKKKYRYNLLGVGLAAFRIPYQKKCHYYCSEFVRDLFEECGIIENGEFQKIVQPVHFLEMSGSKVIYRGKLSDYLAG